MAQKPKESYRELCKVEPSIPLFSSDWWLDAAAGESNWDVVLVENKGHIAASLPYVVQKRMGRVYLVQPPLTQTLGPWIRSTPAKYARQLAREKDLMEALIDQLPFHHQFAQNWHHEQTNWLPFYWRGFKQTTRYTYRLNSLIDEAELWNDLQENIRREIKKARDRYALHIRDNLNIDSFIELNEQTFRRQGMQSPTSSIFIKRLDSYCVKNKARRIFIAEDERGNHHAGVYIVWDQNSAYYLMGGSNPLLRNSGAGSLCMWEAIRYASQVTKSFDFEGSMIESVERYFRAFGAVQTPYFHVYRTNSKVLRAIRCFRDLFSS